LEFLPLFYGKKWRKNRQNSKSISHIHPSHRILRASAAWVLVHDLLQTIYDLNVGIIGVRLLSPPYRYRSQL